MNLFNSVLADQKFFQNGRSTNIFMVAAIKGCYAPVDKNRILVFKKNFITRLYTHNNYNYNIHLDIQRYCNRKFKNT